MAGQKHEARLRADVPAIHVLRRGERSWMPGTSPGITVLRRCANFISARRLGWVEMLEKAEGTAAPVKAEFDNFEHGFPEGSVRAGGGISPIGSASPSPPSSFMSR